MGFPHIKKRLLWVMLLGLMSPWLLPDYSAAEVRDWNRTDDPLYESIGLHGGMASGFGLSYKFPVKWWLYGQVTGGIWNTKENKRSNLGLEIQYILRQTGRDRIFLDAGSTYFYHKDNGQVKDHMNAGFGVGIERLYGERVSVQLQVDFIYQGNEESMMLFPQVGMYYYF